MIGNEELYSDGIEMKNDVLPKTFFWMFLGLLGTALVSWYTYSSGLFATILVEGYFSILLITEVIVVLLFSFLFRKLSPTMVGILYFIYAAINGVSLATIFYVFELNSVILLFIYPVQPFTHQDHKQPDCPQINRKQRYAYMIGDDAE